MGKTAVFVLATLQQLEPVEGQVSVLVLCHTRELAFQISKEYERFAKYMSNLRTAVFFGGVSIKKDEEALKKVLFGASVDAFVHTSVGLFFFTYHGQKLSENNFSDVATSFLKF